MGRPVALGARRLPPRRRRGRRPRDHRGHRRLPGRRRRRRRRQGRDRRRDGRDRPARRAARRASARSPSSTAGRTRTAPSPAASSSDYDAAFDDLSPAAAAGRARRARRREAATRSAPGSWPASPPGSPAPPSPTTSPGCTAMTPAPARRPRPADRRLLLPARPDDLRLLEPGHVADAQRPGLRAVDGDRLRPRDRADRHTHPRAALRRRVAGDARPHQRRSRPRRRPPVPVARGGRHPAVGGRQGDVVEGGSGVPGTGLRGADRRAQRPRRHLRPHRRRRSRTATTVPLYVGDTTRPGHVVLVTGSDSDSLTIYDPASGQEQTISRDDFTSGHLGVSGWDEPWFAVTPSS